MALYLGSSDLSSTNFYLGSNAVSKMYQGSTEVYAPSSIPGITTSGLLNYIDINRGSYTNGSSTLTDLSGNSKDAAIIGTDTVATDQYGYGDVWIGGTSGNKLQYTEGTTPLWGEYTISLWGSFETTNLTYSRICSITNQSRSDWTSHSGKFGYHGWGAAMGNWSTNQGTLPGQSVHMFTYFQRRVANDTTNINLGIWVDDQLVVSRIASNTNSSRDDAYGYSVGNRYGSLNMTTNRLDLYNYAFYTKELSQTEIETNYNAQKADFGHP